MAQQPKFLQGHLGVARSLGSGETLVSWDNTVSSTFNFQRAGDKIALAAPTTDPVPVFFTAEPQGCTSRQRREAPRQLVLVKGMAGCRRRSMSGPTHLHRFGDLCNMSGQGLG